MSDGIQKVAGSKLRQILNAMTTNRVTGIFTGFSITALIQSSSATTVLVVSFVNAGLLSLKQSISVIMGANIGTTVTAVMVTVFGFSKFSLGSYSIPLFAIAVPLLFLNNNKLKSFAEFLIGFSLLFLGISLLKDAVPEMNEQVLHFLADLNGYGLGSTVIFVLIGTLLTVVLQSSSAAMTLTLVLCEQGIIQFDMAAAIVLGENIGTTITANIAAFVGNAHAKRAARAHFIFNVFGVIWMIPLLGIFLKEIDLYMVSAGNTSPYLDQHSVKWALTIFHICFNLINTLLLIWFIDFIAKVVTKMVPSTEKDGVFSMDYIGGGVMKTPEISIIEASKECARLGKLVASMNQQVEKMLSQTKPSALNEIYTKIKEVEDITDVAEEEVAKYLSKLSEDEISKETSIKVRSLLSIINDIESIGDIFYQLTKVHQRKVSHKIYFLPEQRSELKKMLDLLTAAFAEMNKNLDLETKVEDIQPAKDIELEINVLRRHLRKMHLAGIETGDFNVKSAMNVSEFYSGFERIGDYVYKINEALSGKV